MQDNDNDSASQFLKAFEDPDAVAMYTENVKRFLPGMDGLHRMMGILLAEQAPENAHVLILGAGGGLELKALADAYPAWSFVGVDPAPEMLRLAQQTAGSAIDRIEFIEGYIDDAPKGPFDAAACLLTLHFLPPEERTRTVREIHRRLRPGGPFVAAHGSFPQTPDERTLWLDRYAAYGITAGADPEMATAARNAIDASDIMLSPEEDEAILRAGGFPDVQQFYAAFTWRGWIGHA